MIGLGVVHSWCGCHCLHHIFHSVNLTTKFMLWHLDWACEMGVQWDAQGKWNCDWCSVLTLVPGGAGDEAGWVLCPTIVEAERVEAVSRLVLILHTIPQQQAKSRLFLQWHWTCDVLSYQVFLTNHVKHGACHRFFGIPKAALTFMGTIWECLETAPPASCLEPGTRVVWFQPQWSAAPWLGGIFHAVKEIYHANAALPIVRKLAIVPELSLTQWLELGMVVLIYLAAISYNHQIRQMRSHCAVAIILYEWNAEDKMPHCECFWLFILGA